MLQGAMIDGKTLQCIILRNIYMYIYNHRMWCNKNLRKQFYIIFEN